MRDQLVPSDATAAKLLADRLNLHGGDMEGQHGAGDEFVEVLLEALGYPLTVAVLREHAEHWWYA